MVSSPTQQEEALLAEINAGLPPLDWKAGARRYVQGFFDQYSREQIEAFIHTKPLAALTPEDPAGSLTEDVSYLFNFASAVKLLALARGARVLDVACGGGWVSHWLMKLGYRPLGFDISAAFVELARARVIRDPDLDIQSDALDQVFIVHDIEEAPLPSDTDAHFDAAVLESCLHHFIDPISVLHHIRRALAPEGVVLVIEGENRRGSIQDAYLEVMRTTSTLERPYTRSQLTRALALAGLPHIAFFGAVEGYVPEGQEAWVAAVFSEVAAGRNICVAAASREALRRVAPTYVDGAGPSTSSAPGPASTPVGSSGPAVGPLQAERGSALLHLATAVRLASPGWARPVLAAAWRLLRPRSRDVG